MRAIDGCALGLADGTHETAAGCDPNGLVPGGEGGLQGKQSVVGGTPQRPGRLLRTQRAYDGVGKSLRVVMCAKSRAFDLLHGHAPKGFGGADERLGQGKSFYGLDRDAATRHHGSNHASRRTIVGSQIVGPADKARAKRLVDLWQVSADESIHGTNDLEMV